MVNVAVQLSQCDCDAMAQRSSDMALPMGVALAAGTQDAVLVEMPSALLP